MGIQLTRQSLSALCLRVSTVESAVLYYLENNDYFVKEQPAVTLGGNLKSHVAGIPFSVPFDAQQSPSRREVNAALIDIGIYLTESSLTTLCLKVSSVEAAVWFYLENSSQFEEII